MGEAYGPSGRQIQDALDAYLECALWTDYDWSDPEGGAPLDANYDTDDIAPDARESARADVDAFLTLLADEGIVWDGAMSASQLGHDFWLTRNGHGAGFWDRGLGRLGELLTSRASAYGESYAYVGDDGQVWLA